MEWWRLRDALIPLLMTGLMSFLLFGWIGVGWTERWIAAHGGTPAPKPLGNVFGIVRDHFIARRLSREIGESHAMLKLQTFFGLGMFVCWGLWLVIAIGVDRPSLIP